MTVRPAGGFSVTVTVPLVGEAPTFVTLTVKVTGCPGTMMPASCARLRHREVASSYRGIDLDRTCPRAVAGVCVPPACDHRSVHDRACRVRRNNYRHRDIRVASTLEERISANARARGDDAGPAGPRQRGHGQVCRGRLRDGDVADRRRVADVHHPDGEGDRLPRRDGARARRLQKREVGSPDWRGDDRRICRRVVAVVRVAAARDHRCVRHRTGRHAGADTRGHRDVRVLRRRGERVASSAGRCRGRDGAGPAGASETRLHHAQACRRRFGHRDDRRSSPSSPHSTRQ